MDFVDPDSPHKRFMEYSQTSLQNEKSNLSLPEKLVQQAVAFEVARIIVENFSHRMNVQSIGSQPGYSQLIELLACCQLTSFNDILDQIVKDNRVKSVRYTDQ